MQPPLKSVDIFIFDSAGILVAEGKNKGNARALVNAYNARSGLIAAIEVALAEVKGLATVEAQVISILENALRFVSHTTDESGQ